MRHVVLIPVEIRELRIQRSHFGGDGDLSGKVVLSGVLRAPFGFCVEKPPEPGVDLFSRIWGRLSWSQPYGGAALGEGRSGRSG